MTLMRPLLSSCVSWLCPSPRPLYCMRDVRQSGGERENKRREWGAEVFFMLGGVKADLEWGVPPVGNYQSLRNAAAAFTRQAAARLQRPCKHASLHYPVHRSLCGTTVHTHTHTHTHTHARSVCDLSEFSLMAFWVYLCHYCLTVLLLFIFITVITDMVFFCNSTRSAANKRDRIMSVRDCLSVQVLRHCVFMLICWYENQIVGNILVFLSNGAEKRRLHPLDVGNLSCFPDFKVM